MPDITDYLEQIAEAVKGKEVRSSIVNAIQTCYDDGHAGSTDLTARQRINSLAADLDDTNDALTDLNAVVQAVPGSLIFDLVDSFTVSGAKSNLYRMGNLVIADIHMQFTGSSTGDLPVYIYSDDIPVPVTGFKSVTSQGTIFVKPNDRGIYVIQSGVLFETTFVFITESDTADIVFKRRIVEELPEVGIENCVYFVLVDESSEDNKYEEWVYIQGAWERLGGGGGISKLPVINSNINAEISMTTTIERGE